MSAKTPDSGIQWLMVIGAVFVILSVNPAAGYLMLSLGIGAWIIYNIFNIPRQF